MSFLSMYFSLPGEIVKSNSVVSAPLLNMKVSCSVYSLRMSIVSSSVRKIICIDLLLCLTVEKTWLEMGKLWPSGSLLCSIRDAITTLCAAHSAEEASIARSGPSTRLSAGSASEKQHSLEHSPGWKEEVRWMGNSKQSSLLTTFQGLLQGQRTSVLRTLSPPGGTKASR